MLKKTFYILIFLNFYSCRFPSYYFTQSSQNTGLDFTNGKWLINDIDCPPYIYKQISDLAYNDFKTLLSNRLYTVYSERAIILPKTITINPSKKLIKEIKTGTNFDYFINIKASSIKKQFGNVDLTPHKFYSDRKNSVEVIIEVYDLNLTEVIYSQSVVGSIASARDNNDVHFSQNNKNLIINSYKKLMKNIIERSLKN